MLLQFVYIALQIWGWWLWTRAPVSRSVSHWRIARLSAKAWLVTLTVTAAGAAGLGALMAANTRADLPYWDATATAISLAAQVLQAKKVLESWLVFMAGNLVFIGIYLDKSLYLTAVLFVVSTCVAASGYRAWHVAAVAATRRQRQM